MKIIFNLMFMKFRSFCVVDENEQNKKIKVKIKIYGLLLSKRNYGAMQS